jgi:hypothetical protein
VVGFAGSSAAGQRHAQGQDRDDSAHFVFPSVSLVTARLLSLPWFRADHFPNILSTSSRDGLQCGPAMFPFSWFHHQSRFQANFAAQGARTGSDRNRASWLTRSLLLLIMTSPGIR